MRCSQDDIAGRGGYSLEAAYTILVCNLLMSAVHEEVTAVAFHGHAYSKMSQIFVSQQFGMAVTQVSHERIPLGVIERSCSPLRKELPAVALPR